ncbi:prenyltransferase/squalene oxidase repeat-containing protein [Micromonospora azadirachtae]|uniref:Prenyltransferase/squalene oxidase repeat-containing protein n=1 Tax=Micromonospora azadirachtae TaxID=1970735 RepID=A0ABW2ZUU0_9ACTN
MASRPDGHVSPSVYETARLVSLAPWLTGHAERVRFLLRSQRADGGWGPPGEYALVPTLSATEALLTVAATSPASALLTAVDRGLQALTGWLAAARPIPDTPAIDLIVPALVEAINARLPLIEGLSVRPVGSGVGLPIGMDGRRLTAVRGLIAGGGTVPPKLLHALEIVGDLAGRAQGVAPTPSGIVGASPAATAAWLGGLDGATSHPASRAYLESVVEQNDGLAPCATPITVFERSWVVSTLARAGLTVPAAPELIRSLTADLTADGTPTGPGLPADADTTSVTLYALTALGAPADVECLWRYETDEGFCTWPGEDGFSLTTNAHVLDALTQHVAVRPDASARHRGAIRRLVDALQSRQEPDGSWQDRWHASPYYATMCCTLALADAAEPPSAGTLTRAAQWVVASQQADGSWGRWGGTAEESAYAVQVLVAAGRDVPGADAALLRARPYLERHSAAQDDGPALWHDKDLYRPAMIVRAALVAARHVTARTVQEQQHLSGSRM